MENKHTPGPWQVTSLNLNTIITNPNESGRICTMNERSSYNDEERQANAKLIAAAPQLLEALKLVKTVLDKFTLILEWSNDDPVIIAKQSVNEAIKQATE